MRASRLLRILLALQNRGRLTASQLSEELEVTRRTIMRDIDALAEAGLPIVVHRGNRGGIELGFNYRSRLVGLSALEAEALGVLLALSNPALAELKLLDAAKTGRDKLVESMPSLSRERIELSQRRFQFSGCSDRQTDLRIAALAGAIRDSVVVRIRSKSATPQSIHPVALQFGAAGWAVIDDQSPNVPISQDEIGDINVSARRFSVQSAL
jgi:predicted DNA-binding transcriptional regulator YafY